MITDNPITGSTLLEDVRRMLADRDRLIANLRGIIADRDRKLKEALDEGGGMRIIIADKQQRINELLGELASYKQNNEMLAKCDYYESYLSARKRADRRGEALKNVMRNRELDGATMRRLADTLQQVADAMEESK